MNDEKFKSSIRVSNSGPHAATVSVSIPYTIGSVSIPHTIGARAQQHEDERAQWAARMRVLEHEHEDERAQWAARMRVLEHERAAAVEAARVAREERDAALVRVDALLARARVSRGEVKP